MWQCQHCNQIFEFTKTADKANHSRWCDKNPKRKDYINNPKLINAVNEAKDRKYGPIKAYTVECAKCNSTVEVKERELTFPSKDKYYCSRSCANSHVVTFEHKKKTSESLTGKEYVPEEHIVKKCKECGTEFTYVKTGRSRHKNFCSKSCSTKYTARSRNVELRKTRSAFRNYRLDCAFRFNLADYPDEFDFALVEQHGWYKAKNRGDNLNGVSRDHMVSVRYGFDNNIPPEHIKHPANCRLLQHNSNVSKGTENSITYEQLLERILIWNAKYNHGT